jgi:hypothetical protein
MSRFLRVSVINDRIQDIIEASSMLLESLQQTETCDAKQKEMAADIYSLAVDLKSFISQWECEPIIYTGQGSTDDIISMLDRLITKAENKELPT